MPSRRHSATVPPVPAERAATGVTDPDPAIVYDPPDLADAPPPPGPLYVHIEDAPTAAYAPGSVVPASLRSEVLDVAEGTATRSPNPLAGKRTYKAKQAAIVDGVRVRRGELAQLSPTSGLARSVFMVLVEDEDDAPPAVVAAFAEAEEDA